MCKKKRFLKKISLKTVSLRALDLFQILYKIPQITTILAEEIINLRLHGIIF